MMRRGKTRSATTIIEVVMVLVILSIALPPLVTAFADASMQSIHPSLTTVASFLATDRMEEIVARRYRGTQSSVNGYDAITTANFPNESPVTGFPVFSRTVTIAQVDANLNPSGTPVGYKKVTVTVAWNSGSDRILLERVFAEFE